MEMRIAFTIVFFLQQVNPTIDLHDQVSLMAVKIDYETVNDLLPAEMEAFQPTCAQVIP
jgi:hypothetical protein